MKRLVIAFLFLPVLLLGQSIPIFPGLYAHPNPSAGDAAYQKCIEGGGSNFVCYPIKVDAIGAEAQSRVTSIFGAFFDWLTNEHLYYVTPKGKCYGDCVMAITFQAAVAAGSSDANSVTTSGIDTTGATLIVISVAYQSGSTPTISDSKGNTWTALTLYSEAHGVSNRLYYTIPTSTGAGHTFTISLSSSFPALAVASFTGTAASSVFDVQNGNSQVSPGSASLATNSITPSANNYLVIASGMTGGPPASFTPNSGFTVGATALGTSGLAYGTSIAYLIQTTATAENVTWTAAGGTAQQVMAVAIASFKVASGAVADNLDWLHRNNIFHEHADGILERVH